MHGALVTAVLSVLTVRGSIVGTRKDMMDALDFFTRGLTCGGGR